MPSFLNTFFDKAKHVWGRTSVSQRILIGGLTATCIAVFFLLIFWLNQPDWKVLYSNLFKEDASAVVKKLQADKVRYKIEEGQAGATTILVAADKAYDLRLSIAGEGILHGQGLGFEIFDEIKVGQTDFVQRINYQRALQGELARTISEFPQVERARIHLVLPTKTLFIEEQSPPSASVVLKLKEGEKGLEPNQVEGIVNLVALSVEGLDRERITVTDTKGKILYSPKGEGSVQGMTTTQLENKLTVEATLERRIEEMLSPLYGPNRVIAKVNANLDFSKRTIHKELFDPESAVVRSEQRSEESQTGRANLEQGVPEPNFRGDGFGGALSAQDANRETRTTNYEINKEEHDIIAPMGELQRLSVAVIVDGTYAEPAEGSTGPAAFTPRTAEELVRVRELVSNAVGIDQGRGDTIEVTSMSFGGPEIELKPNLLAIILEYAQRLGKPFLNGVLVFLFLILVVRPVVMALIRPRTEVEGVEGLAGLPEGEGRLALEESDEETEMAFDQLRKIEDIRAHAVQLSEQNMDGAMAIIKSWLKEEAA
jgi:flagellar M-ring protein FliF